MKHKRNPFSIFEKVGGWAFRIILGSLFIATWITMIVGYAERGNLTGALLTVAMPVIITLGYLVLVGAVLLIIGCWERAKRRWEEKNE